MEPHTDKPQTGGATKKLAWKASTLLSPVPAVMVSCGGVGAWRPNIITIAWTGTVCSEPPMLSISVRPERYSYEIIRQTQEFVVNVPSVAQAHATDWCGVKSGRDGDKFAGAGLTPAPALQVKPPIIAECPLNLECRVTQMLPLGSHVLCLAEIVAVQVTADLLDGQGHLRLERDGLIAFAHGQYYRLGECLGHFGWSVRRKPGPRTR